VSIMATPYRDGDGVHVLSKVERNINERSLFYGVTEDACREYFAAGNIFLPNPFPKNHTVSGSGDGWTYSVSRSCNALRLSVIFTKQGGV